MIKSGLRPEEQAEVWRRYRTGESMRSISRTLDRSLKAVRRLISAYGGRAPRPRCPSGRRLSLAEREEILRGVAAGDSCRCIARRLDRAPSTVSRGDHTSSWGIAFRPCVGHQAPRAGPRNDAPPQAEPGGPRRGARLLPVDHPPPASMETWPRPRQFPSAPAAESLRRRLASRR